MKIYNFIVNFFYLTIVGNVNVVVSRIKELKVSNIKIKIGKKQAQKSIEDQKPQVENKQPENGVGQAEKLYLNEKFLRVVKMANKNVDSKSIVDRATKKPIEQVLKALDNLDESKVEDIEYFIETCLHEPGIEITKADLVDWREEPEFLQELKNNDLISFSKSLNKIWLDLYKKFDSTKLDENCVSSHLPMKYPFVVPGGRFIEIYYWDTYWTMEGLLVCGMFETAKQMIENFVHFIQIFGFIPNGSRVYYLNRSQPPYFSHMVMKYYQFCMESSKLSKEQKDQVKKFVLGEALDCMIKEHSYWMKNKLVEVEVNNIKYRLNIFKASTGKPRPESYFEDIHTASEYQTEEERAKVYCDIASAAESGYDFSSRWFKDPMNMSTIQTSDIIPVDLNAVLFRTELIISELCLLKGDLENSRLFKKHSIKRRLAVNKLLWSSENYCWADYNMKSNKLMDHFYVSNLSPICVGMKPPLGITELEIISKHQRLFEGYNGGVPVSFLKTTQQWDFNNVWAPNQHSLIMMLLNHDREQALKLAKKFVNTVYLGWKRSGMVFEKYDVHVPGERGTGGEYEVQSGFGWTNGVVFTLINTFKDELLL